MKQFTLLTLFLMSLTARANVVYLDPLPDARFVSINNNLIIGLDKALTNETLNTLTVKVSGTKSGLQTGTLRLTTDKKKVLWIQERPFAQDEIVTVTISSSSSVIEYNSSRNFSYSFYTEKSRRRWDTDNTLRSELGDNYRAPFQRDDNDLPELEVTKSDNPSHGKIFLSNFFNAESYLVIAENNGIFYFARPLVYEGMDFKVQPNGTLTYFETKRNKFFQLDRNYNMIDSFATGNGYNTDVHELRLLPNGHALLMAYDAQYINMSMVVPGGDTNASVIGLIIQELDENKDVVFQWRSWDHFQITDATHLNFTASTLDYVHGNAIEEDTDGNLMISCRHMDEITKIDRHTGDIIWRLGGKHNEFSFVNDTIQFSHQHAIRRIANGNVTLFDNGNYHTPEFSRAIEYSLDEVNKIATLVWEYRNEPTIYGKAMGYVQRLDNGNTLIGWGYTSPTLTEVTPEKNITLEMKLSNNMVSYRVYKFDWDSTTSVGNNNGSIPNTYSLSQNYPNPFNPITTIDYSIPVAGNVTLKVYDIMGREVGSLVNGYKPAGSYNVTFGTSKLASGVYIYKIESGNFTESKKMVLMK
ncbi:MAG: aryl-sulfate sulfotransferase [Ignavibacteriae bacterium]|nr:aryl-sulfate sulfotransferase [Ignavibacteriota bacterium]